MPYLIFWGRALLIEWKNALIIECFLVINHPLNFENLDIILRHPVNWCLSSSFSQKYEKV